jgi:Protein of unknown function DUF262
MKNFDSRTYSINDFLEWEDKKQLELSPKFQRRSVWTDTARSYLMDTIVRGKPIPKIFIRQKINPQTRISVREVVDGQQRLRTILSFLHDGFQISKRHNSQYGGFFFSQLDQVDEEIQTNILNYELSVDLLVNMPDPEVLDVFGRLNSYAVVLNAQEKINAQHFGPFKTLADSIAHSLNAFWLGSRILSEQQILRMGDVTLTADLLIAMTAGIRSKKQIAGFYSNYEKEFPYDSDDLERKFRHTIETIQGIFGDTLRSSEFHRNHLFYTLFTAIYHAVSGIPNLPPTDVSIRPNDFARIAIALEKVDEIYATEDIKNLTEAEIRFLQDSRRATTDSAVRIRRSEFILSLLSI